MSRKFKTYDDFMLDKKKKAREKEYSILAKMKSRYYIVGVKIADKAFEKAVSQVKN